LPEKKFRYNTFSSLSLAYTEKKKKRALSVANDIYVAG
jgi:hypothetical protein